MAGKTSKPPGGVAAPPPDFNIDIPKEFYDSQWLQSVQHSEIRRHQQELEMAERVERARRAQQTWPVMGEEYTKDYEWRKQMRYVQDMMAKAPAPPAPPRPQTASEMYLHYHVPQVLHGHCELIGLKIADQFNQSMFQHELRLSRMVEGKRYDLRVAVSEVRQMRLVPGAKFPAEFPVSWWWEQITKLVDVPRNENPDQSVK